jgi:hypothetical protein
MIAALGVVQKLLSGFFLVWVAAARKKMALLCPSAMAAIFLRLLRIDHPTSELVGLMRAPFSFYIPASGRSARLHQEVFSVSSTGN